jgi:DNA repair exonuclease SbcCD ATPase subunit
MSLMQSSLRSLNTVSPVKGQGDLGRDALDTTGNEPPFERHREDHAGVEHDLFELSKQVEQMELLRGKLSSTIAHIDSVVREIDGLRRDNHGLEEACERERRKAAEGLNQIHRLELKLAAFNDIKADYGVLLEEVAQIRSELEQKATQHASLEVEHESTLSALHHFEVQQRIIKNLLDEATEQNARLSRQLREMEPSHEHYKTQIIQLQAALEAERLAKEQSSLDVVDELEGLRSDVKHSEARLEAALARADAHERMLNDSRANYRDKLDELRLSERRAIDLGIQLTNAQRRAEIAESDQAGLHARLARLETERSQYAARLEAMNRALTEKDAAIVLAQDRTTFVSARLEECQRAARAERDKFEADLATLKHLFEPEFGRAEPIAGKITTSPDLPDTADKVAIEVVSSNGLGDTAEVVVPYRTLSVV